MAAEQLANLYQTTLGSSYSIADGHITVASASGAPTSGPFSLTILDSAGTTILMVYRVASVSGTTFTGAAETTDVNCPSGSIVIGTTLSVDAINNLFTSTSGFIQPLTAPVSANFSQTNFNTGSGVVTTQTNNSSPVTSITLLQSDINTTQEIAAITKAKIASTFTVTIAISSAADLDGKPIVGLFLWDGGSNAIIYGTQWANNNLTVVVYSALSGAVSSVAYASGNAGGMFGIGPLLWLRIKEDASHRTYYISSDGINFASIFQEAVSAHFTTADYGFAAENRNAAITGNVMVTCYSFTETNP